MTAKALEGKQLAAVIARMRRLLEERFDGNQARLAVALEFTPTAVSDVLGGTKGPGLRMLVAVARECGITLDELLGLSGGGPVRDTWASHERWATLVKEARAMFPKVAEPTWHALGRLSGVAPPALTPAAVGSLAVAWDQHATATSVSPSADTKPPKPKPRAA